jgi:hypothetical protein
MIPSSKTLKENWVSEFANIKRRNDKQTCSCDLSCSHTLPSSLVPTTSTIRTSAKKEGEFSKVCGFVCQLQQAGKQSKQASLLLFQKKKKEIKRNLTFRLLKFSGIFSLHTKTVDRSIDAVV